MYKEVKFDMSCVSNLLPSLDYFPLLYFSDFSLISHGTFFLSVTCRAAILQNVLWETLNWSDMTAPRRLCKAGWHRAAGRFWFFSSGNGKIGLGCLLQEGVGAAIQNRGYVMFQVLDILYRQYLV